MKKIALILIFALLLTVFLASCGGNTGEGKETTIDFDDFLESISKAINDGTYGTLPDTDPEVMFVLYDNYAEVTGCKNAIGDISIPSEYDGKPVTKIAEGAFEGYRSMNSVVLPEGITEIGDKAFFGCVGLTEISIPDAVINIGENSFYGCSALKTVNIGKGVTDIGASAFGYCTSLETINVSDENAAFKDLNGVLVNASMTTLIVYPAGKTDESYTIPVSVTTVSNLAFAYSQKLKTVTIGDSVTSLGDNTFRSCASLENVTLGSGLTFIGANTFISCTALTNIVIPEGVKTIGYLDGATECGGSFTGCSALSEISLPSTLLAIYSQSFSECKSLKTVKFAGSSAEWTNISIGEGNENLGVAAVSFGK